MREDNSLVRRVVEPQVKTGSGALPVCLEPRPRAILDIPVHTYIVDVYIINKVVFLLVISLNPLVGSTEMFHLFSGFAHVSVG
jgi:hypothetical protein